jgi:hypothetical protein
MTNKQRILIELESIIERMNLDESQVKHIKKELNGIKIYPDDYLKVETTGTATYMGETIYRVSLMPRNIYICLI